MKKFLGIRRFVDRSGSPRRQIVSASINNAKDDPECGTLAKSQHSIDATVADDSSQCSCRDDELACVCCINNNNNNNSNGVNESSLNSKRRVHFATNCILYPHPWIYGSMEEDHEETQETDNRVISKQTIWYNKSDVAQFKGSVRVYVRRLQLRQSHHTSSYVQMWAENLQNAFQALQETNQDNTELIMASALATDPLLVGLEKWVDKEWSSARAQQRKAMCKAVVDSHASGMTCPQALRQLSCEASRGCSLFAIYVALSVTPTEPELMIEV